METFLTHLKHTAKLVLVSILCISCSLNIPRSSIAALDPLSAEPYPYPVITDDQDHYTLSLEPLDNVGDMLVFGVRVYNKQPDSIYIDPRTWKMQTLSLSNGVEKIDTLELLSTQEIASSYRVLGKKIKEAENNKQVAIAIVAIVLIVGLIVIIANADDSADSTDDVDEGDDDDQIVDWVSSSISFSYYGGSASRFSNELSPKEQINILNDIASRYDRSEILPTYIQPFEELTYEVYFRRPDGLRRFNLQWQIGDQQFSWDFIHNLDKWR